MKKSIIAIAFSVVMCQVGISANAFYEMTEAPTKEEILERYIELDLNKFTSTYKVEPSLTETYYEGILSDETLENALNTVNFIRYMTGLSDVKLNDEYNELTQKASLVMSLNRSISHTPVQPEGLRDEIYKDGYKGASSSNISSGRKNLYDTIVHGWMADVSSSSNVSTVGHRRWILNPSMQETGFGSVGTYYSMYSFDNFSGQAPQTGVVWPSEDMPVEFFGTNYPWSFSPNDRIYGNVTVTLTKSTGEVTEFTSADNNASGKYLGVNNSGYGKAGCVIFRPYGVSYSADDEYEVEIFEDGVLIANYEVDFFSIYEAYNEYETFRNSDGSTTELTTNEYLNTSSTVTTYPNGIVINENGNSFEVTGVKEETEIILYGDYTTTSVGFKDEIIKKSTLKDDGIRIKVGENGTYTVVDNAKKFSDVGATWYADPVDFVTSRELFNGTSETEFSPNQKMSNAMIWTVLYRLEDAVVEVEGNAWYSEAEAWIKTIYEEAEKPTENMTREMLAMLLFLVSEEESSSYSLNDLYSDAGEISDWALDAMSWAVGIGIIQGSNGELNPQGEASRAEVATMLQRYISR